VVEVLQPFEVADSDTSSIAENIGQELNSFVEENLFSFEGSGSIGCFNNQFGFESMGIIDIDRLFKSGRDEEIAKL
jgi:hypothetical protein